jgi:nucleolar protein 56
MKGHIIFNSVLGCFVFDKDGNLVEKGEFEALKKKYDPTEPDDEQLRKILVVFKDKKYFPEFYVKNLEFTKRSIRDNFSDDILIMQAIESIDEVNKITNLLVKRLREWYSYYSPELSRDVSDNAKFVEIVVRGEARLKGGMGVDIKRDDLHAIIGFAGRIKGLYELKAEQASYIEKKMHEVCPNLLVVAGSNIGAKLIQLAGGLKRLAGMPASTLQLLGAEKALFRHMRNKKYLPPKYGIIHEHQIISKAKKKGKAARLLADKITIAARVDYFKGEFIGDKLKREIEAKVE